jgi:F-type H+-transporting ATPase subunit alpha
MKQKQYSPLSVAEMGVSLYAAERGFLDDVPLSNVVEFEAGLLSFMRARYEDFMVELNKSCGFNDEIDVKLKEAVEAFKATQA